MSNDEFVVTSPEPAGSPAPAQERMPTWAKVVLACLAGLVALVVLGGLVGVLIYRTIDNSTADAEAASNSFIDTVQAGDADALYALTDEMFREQSSRAEVAESLPQVSSDLQGQEKVSGKGIFKLSGGQPTKAVVLYRIVTDADPMYVRVVLAERGEEWKVVGFRYDKKPFELERDKAPAP